MASDSNRRRHGSRRGGKGRDRPQHGPRSRKGVGASSSSGRGKSVRPTSSFQREAPSIAPVRLPGKEQQPPVWRGYLFGLAGVTLLILLGGGEHTLALACALLLPGLGVMLHPPQRSPGGWIDRFALLFLGVLLLAFLPVFYWPQPEWRVAAVEQFGIDLPTILSVQPLISFEAWLAGLAGLVWFYLATSWQINYSGRRRFYLVFSGLMGVLATVLIWGNLHGSQYPGAGSAGAFSFFPDPRHMAGFLAVAGVFSLGYATTALGTRQVLPVFGLVAFALCGVALVGGLDRMGLSLLLAGLVVFYLLQFSFGSVPKRFKWGFPLFLLALSIFLFGGTFFSEQEEGLDGGSAIKFSAMETGASPARGDVSAMLWDAPLTGHGLGNFSAVFPQYRTVAVADPLSNGAGSDVLWIAAEAGVLGLLVLLGLLVAYFARCVGCHRGPSGSYRLVAVAALIVFLLNGLLDGAGHQPGMAYLAVLLAALALPAPRRERRSLPPRVWQICGGVLVLFGLAWGLAGLTGLPLHSKVALANYQSAAAQALDTAEDGSGAKAVERWIAREPLNWQAYHQRALNWLATAGEREAAAADFKRARFVEPKLGVVVLEEGFAWIPYDASRALAAWREMFSRQLEDRASAYSRLVAAVEGNRELLDGLLELSAQDLDFRVELFQVVPGANLMRELERERQTDPNLNAYTLEQRSTILKRWIQVGDREAVEQFLRENQDELHRAWWLWSLLRKEQADFEEAVAIIRAAIESPALPGQTREGLSLERLELEFSTSPDNIVNGTNLLHRYIEQQNFRAISNLIERMIAARANVPDYIHYWRAESLYRQQDYIESWFLFEDYLKQQWESSPR